MIVAVHGLAAIAALSNALPLSLKLALLLADTCSLYKLLQKYYFAPGNCQLRYSERSGWWLAQGGAFRQVQIMASTRVTDLATILHYKQHNGVKQAILIFNDALNTEQYRQLKVTLKISDHVD